MSTSVSLKKNWDYGPHIDEIMNNHIKRTRELEILLDFLCRKSEGALLISGKRGVGKTSTVFHALNEAFWKLQECNDKVKLVPVLVNAPNFEIRKSSGGEKSGLIDLLEFKRLVLQTLIRSLYQVTVRGTVPFNDHTMASETKSITKTSIRNVVLSFFKEIASKGKINEETIEIPSDLRTDISALYNKAMAKEFKEESNLDKLYRVEENIERKAVKKLK